MADVDFNFSDEENYAAPAAVKKKAAPKAPKAKAPLASSSGHNKAAAGSNKSIEQIYQKKSQLEHILLRPDTYVGSVEPQQQQMWVYDGGDRMVNRNITFVPGLYKIFDEIIVNAADNKVRDSKQSVIRVDIDPESNTIRVYNDGDGVPVEVHKEEGVYVPELIFGHLLTSSNYDDGEKKVTGGRNGYGAKLANIFSDEFVIETCDGSRERRYRQVFRENMGVKEEPVIKKCKASDNWTAITFKPDLAKFKMTHLDRDTLALMHKRVYDLAGCLGKGCKVYLNGEMLKIRSFLDYVNLYLGPKDEGPARVHEMVNDRWEVVVAVSDGQFSQVSFVNNINSIKGGTHVNYIADQIANKLLSQHINKKNKNAGVKAFQVKNHVWVFVNAMIENPAFDSQTKETLTLKASAFGSKAELKDDFIKKVAKCGIVENVLSWATFKQEKDLKKQNGSKRSRLMGIPKLDDANDAGGRSSQDCTLILTEGDSAKALAVSGLSIVGRDRFGVFPLRGKLLNVRDAAHSQIMNNAEISNIKQILGLQHGKVYEDTKSLRYGHLMIMTDQDHDGSHIKGLLINFLHHFFPTLLKIPGFLVEFITPIIKATKGKQSQVFYTMPEYENWKEGLGGNPRGWAIKYYKGLGTSTAAEAKQYFADMDCHKKDFRWGGEEDGECIEMAFSKKKVDRRKEWMSGFQLGTFLDHSASQITYSEFVNRELILFSLADLARSIPSMVDGLKPGQRKILFACFKRKLKADIKVAQLAGYVSEHAAYHHGETSLASTIVGLAQDFVGTNNVNILFPSGQFGTRLQGGKDAASPRYIFTRLASLARMLFPEADDKLLEYQAEEGQSIEPSWYLPILPTVLLNGSDGIGTGWSSFIPNYSPRDIVSNLKRMIEGAEPEPMAPWYKGFHGECELEKSTDKGETYTLSGVATQIDDTTLEITELPVRKWTQDYKEFLEGLIKPEDKNATPFITDYKEYHTDTSVHFVVTMPEESMREALAVGLKKKFSLTTKVSTSNMMLFNAEGKITKYDNVTDIIKDFFDLRLGGYERRKAYLLQQSEQEMTRLENKVRFIMAVVNGDLVISNKKKKALVEELQSEGYDMLPSKKGGGARTHSGEDSEGGALAEGESAVKEEAVSYDYLLGMPLWSLTLEKVQELCSERDDQEAKLAALKATTPKEMWAGDLDNFLEQLEVVEAEDDAAAAKMARQQAAARKGGGAKKKKAPKKKLASLDSDDDEMDFIDDSEDDDFEVVKPKKKAAPKPKPAAPAPKAAAWVPPVAAAPALSGKSAAATGSGKSGGSKGKGVAVADPGEVTSPVAKKKPAAKPAAKKKAAPPPPPSDSEPEEEVDSDEEFMGTSLMDRLKKKAGPTPPPRAAAPRRAAAAKAVVVDSDSEADGSDGGGDDDVEELMDSPSPVKKKPAAAPRRAAAKKAVVLSDDSEGDDDDDFGMDDDDESPAPKKKAPAKPKAAPKAKAAPKPKAAAKPKAPAAGAKRAPAKPVAKAAKGKKAAAMDFPESGDEDEGAGDVTEMSPAVLPAGKVRRMRPSPFNKASGSAGDGGDDEEEDSPAVAERPAARARATGRVPMKSYKDFGSDLEDESEEDGEEDFDEDESDYSGDD